MVKETAQKKKYFEAVGRRKTATARVRLTESGKQSFTVNDKNLEEQFKTEVLRKKVLEALDKSKVSRKFAVSARVRGGGIVAQSEALRHGISRALSEYDKGLRKNLKTMGFLKRDPRMKERKKFGLKKARKASQWSKR